MVTKTTIRISKGRLEDFILELDAATYYDGPIGNVEEALERDRRRLAAIASVRAYAERIRELRARRAARRSAREGQDNAGT